MRPKSKSDTIDLVFSFDTTGSMGPCIRQVRRSVKTVVEELFDIIPDLRIGIISHGDYCDGKDVITSLDLTNDERKICRFIERAPLTDGGDSDECYELVLHHAREFKWTAGRNKALVMIGDALPHRVGYCYRGKVNDLDWENERDLLVEAGINIYPVQAMGSRHSERFWKSLVANPEDIKIDLPQLRDTVEMIQALCLHRAGKLEDADRLLRKSRYSMQLTLDKLRGKKTTKRRVSKRKSSRGKALALDGRFQIFEVDEDCSIKEFVEDQGITFKVGRGFYEFTKAKKPVVIQDYKEVYAEDQDTGEVLEGDEAREVLGIPVGVTTKMRPNTDTGYNGFVQSTSSNRKLLEGTNFLYEVPDWE